MNPNIPIPVVNQLSNDVCTCRDDQVCHLCPESKKQQFIRTQRQGGDPNKYIRMSKKNPNMPSKKEAKRMRREIQSQLSKKLGRRVTNTEMDQIVTHQAQKVRDAMNKKLLQDCGTRKASTGYYCTRAIGHEGPCAAVPMAGKPLL